ncbi:MAG: SPOR domain-containing protein [Rhodocyclaceae bacterium]|nr:SPOR domain-containing protein [Rhodocyclaceae bacterium]
MADDEKQIEIKKRARRRLVGAAALALAAVIVLPMVMDSEPRPLEQDIQVRIPPQTGSNAMASRIEPQPQPVPVQPPAALSPPAERPAPQSAAAPSTAVKSADQVAAVEKNDRPGPAAKPVQEAPVVARQTAATPQPAAPAMDEAARAAAILAGRAPESLPPTRRFVVQVGAYRDRGNATSLQGKLEADGFSAFTERSGDKTRVRIGPFDDRADAESVLARVRRMGLGGSVLQMN